MIKDKLENSELYYGISDRLKQGFEWLKSQDLKNIEPNKYIIDGKNLYANIQEYDTKSDALYEAHRNYIDIQYMISGCEYVGVTNINNCESEIPYDSDNDIEFLTIKKEEENIILSEGDFLVLFPTDAHRPSMDYIEKRNVKKVVVKVLID